MRNWFLSQRGSGEHERITEVRPSPKRVRALIRERLPLKVGRSGILAPIIKLMVAVLVRDSISNLYAPTAKLLVINITTV